MIKKGKGNLAFLNDIYKALSSDKIKKKMLNNYDRVTKILEATEDPEKRKKILRWRKKLEKVHGVEGANQVREDILQNGTNTHLAIQKYLSDEILSEKDIDIYPLIPLLDLIKQQSDILIIEKRIYCDNLKIQGQPDLICTFGGKTTIVDWTTSSTLKKRAWIDHKFIQAGAYSLLAKEERILNVEQLAVVVYIASLGRYQLFIEDDPSLYQKAFLNRLEQFNLLKKANK